ncbi:MAG: COX15/CtaA family protein [Woeseiaceae bacterium]|nr:COX15/CtaA family protein [Woeseiaceae bacterium]
MPVLARISLVLVLVLVTLSSYLRLEHSGIGCDPWPACYGNIGIENTMPDIGITYERLLEEARQPLSWATPLHRLVASVLALLILSMTLYAYLRKNERVITTALLALTVFLAWLGIYSEGLRSPAVVMGNLIGGFTMLGLLGWMVFRKIGDNPHPDKNLRAWILLAIATLSVQIFLGGLTSANFAASACQTLPHCHGSYFPGSAITTAFDLTRTHDIGPTGMVLGGAERADIHKLHRLVAVLTLIAVIGAGTQAWKRGMVLRVWGYVTITLVITEFLVGLSAILSGLPIAVAVAHNWLAALLLLALLKLLAETSAQSGDFMEARHPPR